MTASITGAVITTNLFQLNPRHKKLKRTHVLLFVFPLIYSLRALHIAFPLIIK